MPDLHFSFSELIEETRAIKALTPKFMSSGSNEIFDNLTVQLESIRNCKAGDTQSWKITEDWPLTTVPTSDYEVGGRGGRQVVGTVSSIWEIAALGNNSQKSQLHRKFALVGKASTMVKIIEAGSPNSQEPLAMWRMEIGSNDSPGIHFHTQVLGTLDSGPFPKHLPVPRLPSHMFTPLLALEFLISELFQTKWTETISKPGATNIGSLGRWRNIQQSRLLQTLDWQTTALQNTSGTPWLTLKLLKPKSSLFLDGKN